MNPLIPRGALRFVTSLAVLQPFLLTQAQEFKGAAEAGAPPKASPLTAEEQQATFQLPPGFQIELVAADPDVAKVVAIAFDDAGKMWAITATEYPVDENESGVRARQLYERGGKDRVLVFDTPTRPGRQTPRVFAENLAIPLGILPYKDGVIVGHGPEVLFLDDTDLDGRADQRHVLLSGFGIQDSHLLPHQFTRGPGDWIYLAQGAFNSSQVKDRSGNITPFDQCKIGRFQPDGTRFETVAWGLNNIWGFVINRQGEMFIQEANDLGYPVVPFFLGATYPGIGMNKAKSYAPWQPPLADFSMGGTGLSGLALAEDRNGFPPPYMNVMYVANPIIRQIQAIRIQSEGSGYRLQKLPDFIRCADPWFRPISIQFGPDKCLYIVDWYNKIISHNEVARDHPERDKLRSRIWRVRHQSMSPKPVPDMAWTFESGDLLRHLDAESTWEARAARQQIIDAQAFALVPELTRLAQNPANRAELRLNALWALEGLKKVKTSTLEKPLKDDNRNIRRECVRVTGTQSFSQKQITSLLGNYVDDPDPQVRAELIRTLGGIPESDSAVIAMLVRLGKAALNGPMVKAQQSGVPAKIGPAGDRDFERYLVRAALEKHPQQVTSFLDGKGSRRLSVENRIVATLALPPEVAAPRIAELVSGLQRAVSEDEFLLLAQSADHPSVASVLENLLRGSKSLDRLLNLLIGFKDRIDLIKLGPVISRTIKPLLSEKSGVNEAVLIRAAGTFHLRDLEPHVVSVLTRTNETPEGRLAALKALREMGSGQVELFQRLALTTKAGDPLQREAIGALTTVHDPRAVPLLVEIWPVLPAVLRKVAVDHLSSSKTNSKALLLAIKAGSINSDDIDEYTLEKLERILGRDAELAQLRQTFNARLRPVLKLGGGKEDCIAAGINLAGPFTVETWIKLDPGIGNSDGILGRPSGADFNFFDSRLRVFAGPQHGDVIIANRKMEPEVWTHVAVTRSEMGRFKIYIDGELDTDKGKPMSQDLMALDVGRTSQAQGTAGLLAEYRVWNSARSADEIRAQFKTSLEGEDSPAGLDHYFTGTNWGTLNGRATIIRTSDVSPLASLAETRALQAKFSKHRALTAQPGNPLNGKSVFANTCLPCHNVQGAGGNLGPTLNGAGLLETEGLLRALLTPNEAVESGYYQYRVETKDAEIIDGFLAGQTENALILRQPNSEDRHIPRVQVKRAAFTRKSMMPEGLLEALPGQDVADLFAYLRTLK